MLRIVIQIHFSISYATKMSRSFVIVTQSLDFTKINVVQNSRIEHHSIEKKIIFSNLKIAPLVQKIIIIPLVRSPLDMKI